MWCRVSLKIVLLKFRWPCFFEIILVNSHVGLTRCAIFTAILSRKQAASILAKKVELLLRKVDLSGYWEVLQNAKWFFVFLRERHKKFCANNYYFVSGFEKRGHFAPAIFERTPVFKWLLLGQTLPKLK